MSRISQAETAFQTRQDAVRPDPAARGILISFNPRAGSRSCRNRAEAIGHVLADAGYHVRSTADLDELAALSAEGLESGDLRAVLAVGGDGTASVVRRHVPLAVPMVPVPMGTENLLGRFVGQPTTPDSVLRTVEEGVTVGLDLGCANGKHFLLMISAGFDAEVIRSLHESRQANINRTRLFSAYPASDPELCLSSIAGLLRSKHRERNAMWPVAVRLQLAAVRARTGNCARCGRDRWSA